jgi:excisionase family DNA binding protein
MTTTEEYISVPRAAEILGVGRPTIAGYVRAGKIKAVRLSHKTLRIKKSDFEDFIAQAYAAPVKGAPGNLPAKS